jgi:hypothetical protein
MVLANPTSGPCLCFRTCCVSATQLYAILASCINLEKLKYIGDEKKSVPKYGFVLHKPLTM